MDTRVRILSTMFLVAATLVLAAPAAEADVTAGTGWGSIFNPNAVGTQGALSLTNAADSITFDTDALSYSGTASGSPISGSGVAFNSESGNVQLAAFNFDSINISSGVNISVNGNRGLVLGSLGTIYLDANIDMTGSNGNYEDPGAGGPGGEGGTSDVQSGGNGTFDSNPPPSYGGKGGNDGGGNGKGPARPGKGYGGGGKARDNQDRGHGGGYGGKGGGAVASRGSKYGKPATDQPVRRLGRRRRR